VVGQRLAQSLTSPGAREMINVTTVTREQALAMLNKGESDIVLVLPANLTESVASGKPTNVEVYYDQGRQTSAGVGLGIARVLINEANLNIKGIEPLLIVQEKPIQATPLRAVDFFVPSMLAMAMLWLGLFGTMMPLVQQREQQVLRRLSASPLRRISLLAGQVSWRLTIGLVQAALFVIVGLLVFGVHVQGSWLLFAGASVLGALVFISMGYVLAGLSRTIEASVALAQVVNFPLMFLSGIFFDPQALPDFLRPVMHVLPPTYLGDAFRQIMVGYTPLYPLWMDFAVLAGFLVVFVAAGLRFFRWEQQ
jgi:ABC-2 type transport system permease protein